MESIFRGGKIILTAALTVLFFTAFAAAVASAKEETNVTSPILMMNSPLWVLLLIIVLSAIFLLPLFVVYFNLHDKDKWKDYPLALPKGSVRALLAFSLIVIIAIMMILFGGVNEIITAMLAILASIVGYYFGHRSAGERG